MKWILAFSLFFYCGPAFSQDCDKMIQAAENAASGRRPDYLDALQKYLAAQRCAPDKEEVIEKKIIELFIKIQGLEEAARKAEEQATFDRQTAIDALKGVQTERDIAKKARENADRAALEAKLQAEKAQKALRASANTALALILPKKDPTLALGLAAYNLGSHSNDPGVAKAFNEIITDEYNTFYKFSFQLYDGLAGAFFAPTGKEFFTFSSGGNVTMQDIDSAGQIASLLWDDFYPHLSCVSRDCKKVIAADPAGNVGAWDLEANLPVILHHWSNDTITALDINTEGLVVTGTATGKISINHLAGQLVKEFKDRHAGKVTAVRFSPDGKYLFTASADSTAILWNLKKQRKLMVVEHKGPVHSLAFSEDGRFTLSGSLDGDAKLWEINKKRDKELRVFKGHEGGITFVGFYPSKPDPMIITGGMDGIIKVWNFAGQEQFRFIGHENAIKSLVVSPDGGSFLTTDYSDFVKMWKYPGMKLTTDTLETSPLMAFSPGGKVLTVRDSMIVVWDTERRDSFSLAGHHGFITAACFSKNDRYLLTGSDDHTARLWDLESQKLVQTFYRKEPLNVVAISPKGNRILTGGGANKEIILYDIQNPADSVKFTGHNGTISSLCFSPGGDSILTSGNDSTVFLWNVKGKKLNTLRNKGETMISAQFSSGGSMIFTRGGNKDAKLWRNPADKKPKGLKKTGVIRSASFSPDGKFLAAINEKNNQKNIVIFDTSGLEVCTYLADFGDYIIEYSGDGRKLYVGNWYGTVSQWLTPQAFIAEKVRPISPSDLVRETGDSQLEVALEAEDVERIIQNGTAGILEQLAQSLLASDDTMAIRIYTVLAEKSPSRRVVSQLAIALDQLGMERSIEKYTAPLLSKCDTHQKLLREAEYFFYQNQFRLAKVFYEKGMTDRDEHYPEFCFGLYQSELGLNNDRFNELLLVEDTTLLKEFANRLSGTGAGGDDYPSKIAVYKKVIILDEKLLAKDTSSQVKKDIALHHNDLGWYYLLNANPAEAEVVLRRGIELDSTNLYLYTNLPPALLLQGKFDEAKVEFLKWADKPFEPNIASYPTFRDAFLADFEAFEIEGAINTPELSRLVSSMRKVLVNGR